MQNQGKSILNALAVPLAKFESDMATLRGINPHHALLPSVGELYQKGIGFKTEATTAMAGTEPCKHTLVEVKKYLEDVRSNAKAVQCLTKSGTTKGKAAPN